jgi:hypothetical protein
MNGTIDLCATIDFRKLSLPAVVGLGRLVDAWARQRYAGPFLLRLARCAADETMRRAALHAGRDWTPPAEPGAVEPGVYRLWTPGPIESRAAAEFFDHLERLDLTELDAEEREVARELVDRVFRPLADRIALELAQRHEEGVAEELYGPPQ